MKQLTCEMCGSMDLLKQRELDRKNQSSRPKKPSCILESEKTEGFLGRKV